VRGCTEDDCSTTGIEDAQGEPLMVWHMKCRVCESTAECKAGKDFEYPGHRGHWCCGPTFPMEWTLVRQDVLRKQVEYDIEVFMSGADATGRPSVSQVSNVNPAVADLSSWKNIFGRCRSAS
jgi:hypothetical protein